MLKNRQKKLRVKKNETLNISTKEFDIDDLLLPDQNETNKCEKFETNKFEKYETDNCVIDEGRQKYYTDCSKIKDGNIKFDCKNFVNPKETVFEKNKINDVFTTMKNENDSERNFETAVYNYTVKMVKSEQFSVKKKKASLKDYLAPDDIPLLSKYIKCSNRPRVDIDIYLENLDITVKEPVKVTPNYNKDTIVPYYLRKAPNTVKKVKMTEYEKTINFIKKQFKKCKESIRRSATVCFVGCEKSGKSSIVGNLIQSQLTNSVQKKTFWEAEKAGLKELDKAWLSDVSENDRKYRGTVCPHFVMVEMADGPIKIVDCPGKTDYLCATVKEVLEADKVVLVIRVDQDWCSGNGGEFMNKSLYRAILCVMRITKLFNLTVIMNVGQGGETAAPDNKTVDRVQNKIGKMCRKWLGMELDRSNIIKVEDVRNVKCTERDAILATFNSKFVGGKEVEGKLVDDKTLLLEVQNIDKPVESATVVVHCHVLSGAVTAAQCAHGSKVCLVDPVRRVNCTIKTLRTESATGDGMMKSAVAFAGQCAEVCFKQADVVQLEPPTLRRGDLLQHQAANEIVESVSRARHWRAQLYVFSPTDVMLQPIANGINYRIISRTIPDCFCRFTRIVDNSTKLAVRNVKQPCRDAKVSLTVNIQFEDYVIIPNEDLTNHIRVFVLMSDRAIFGVGRIDFAVSVSV